MPGTDIRERELELDLRFLTLFITIVHHPLPFLQRPLVSSEISGTNIRWFLNAAQFLWFSTRRIFFGLTGYSCEHLR